jgi:CRP/FNR family nitrogen fixation transcriptional regulator
VKGQVELPVSRYDIADYLAVFVETVCRSITDLQQRGVITWQASERSKF